MAVLLTITAATASITLLAIWTANAALALFPCPKQIPENASGDHEQNADHDCVDDHTNTPYFAEAFSAYSALILLLALTISATMKAAMARIAANPPNAAATFRLPPVTRVPMV